MNRTDLIASIADDTGFTRAEVTRFMDSMVGKIEGSLGKGEKVQISGFGSFEVRRHKARQGVNPSTGERITIPEHGVAKFTPGKALRELVK